MNPGGCLLKPRRPTEKEHTALEQPDRGRAAMWAATTVCAALRLERIISRDGDELAAPCVVPLVRAR